MPQISRNSRHQFELFCLESVIAQDNSVRVIDAFVDYLEGTQGLSSIGFDQKGQSHEGRPAYPSADLLRLYLYGYLNQVRSSRKLAKACEINLEVKWLVCSQSPSHTTIANFRKDHLKGLREVFRSLNRFLKGEDLFQGDVVALDGSKFSGQNSKDNNYTQSKVDRGLKQVDQEIETYLSDLDKIDEREDTLEVNGEEIAKKLERLNTRRQKYVALAEQLNVLGTQGEKQISTTDPDARAFTQSGRTTVVGYNIQSVVEAEHKLITHFEVSNQHDVHALYCLGKGAKDFLGVEELKLLADKGYDSGEELEKCAKSQIETYVSPMKRGRNMRPEGFNKADFIYLEKEDVYECPQGHHLKSNGTWYAKGKNKDNKPGKVKRYRLRFDVCKSCPFRPACIGKSDRGRIIEQSEFDLYIQANELRVNNHKSLYRTRKEIVEHPFGTIKRIWGFDYTLLKTLPKVGAEFALIFTCYNLRRSISIFGVEDLIKRLKEPKNPILSFFYAIATIIKTDIKKLEPLSYLAS